MKAMEVFGLFQKAFFPALFTVLYIFLYIYRVKIFKKMKKIVNNDELANSIEILSKNFKFKIGNIYKTILIPIVLISSVNIATMLLYRLPMFSYKDEPLWFQLVVRSLLNPIAEEVVTRGFIFGCFLLTSVILIEELYQRKRNKGFPRYFHVIWLIFALLLQSYLFASWHDNPALFNWTIRLSGGLIYGILYLANDRNLLPPMIAHIFHNLSITWYTLIFR